MRQIAIGFLAVIAAFSAQADDFSAALEKHAVNKARELVADLIDERISGSSWADVLSKTLPEKLDDRCGYQELVGLRPETFAQFKPKAAKIAGNRIARLYVPMITRLNAKMDYSGVKHTRTESGDYALVSLKVTPTKPGDAPFSLLYRHSTDGSMALCDVVADSNFGDGILKTIGAELALPDPTDQQY
ncbi:hypothetical protein ACYPKM_02680 [Pseudomonas aeruginosa]